MKTTFALTILVATMTLPLAAQPQSQAEKMVELLPPDLFLVIANSGWDRLKPEFEQSDMGKAWNEKSVQTFYQQIKDAVLTHIRAKMAQEGKDGPKFDATISLLKSMLFSGPIVLGAGDRMGPKKPEIYGFLILSAGDKKPQIAADVTKLESLAEKGKITEVQIGKITMHTAPRDKGDDADKPPVLWGWVNHYFVIVVNDEKAMIVQRLAEGGKAAAGPSVYLTALGKLPDLGEGRLVYVDVQRIAKLIETKIARECPQTASRPTTQVANQVVNDLGLAGVKTFVARGGFAGSDVRAESLLTAPAPRTGIFAQVRPVDLTLLDRAPASAIDARVSNVNWAGIYDLVMQTIRAVKPEKFREVEKGIGDFEAKAGFRIRQDLLGNLAGPAVQYSLVTGMMMSPILGGKVTILKLKDAKAFEKAMTALEKFIERKSEGKFQATTQDFDGRTVHFWMIPQLAMMQVTPVWTIRADEFIVATNLQQVNAAVAQATTQNAEGQSVRSTEGFKKLTADLPNELIGFRYTDHKRQSEQTMQLVQQFWPMVAMLAQQQGKVQLPMVVPPAEDISRHMGPEAGYAWFDPDGVRCHDQGSMMSTNLGAIVAASMATSIAMPAFSKARHSAKETVSMNNLKQIALASVMYANDHNGAFPDTIEQLVQGKYLPGGKPLESPLKPAGFTGPSYILIPGHTQKSPPTDLLAYENPACITDGINVAYIDGHVAKLSKPAFRKALAATYQSLGKPMPPVKFPKGKKGWSLGEVFEPEEPSATQPAPVAH